MNGQAWPSARYRGPVKQIMENMTLSESQLKDLTARMENLPESRNVEVRDILLKGVCDPAKDQATLTLFLTTDLQAPKARVFEDVLGEVALQWLDGLNDYLKLRLSEWPLSIAVERVVEEQHDG